jgi:hypothetical protein
MENDAAVQTLAQKKLPAHQKHERVLIEARMAAFLDTNFVFAAEFAKPVEGIGFVPFLTITNDTQRLYSRLKQPGYEQCSFVSRG